VHLPPIVRAWTQNFQWTMGIIRLGFLQDIATWYGRTTPVHSDMVSPSSSLTSVILEKRTNTGTGSAFSMNDAVLRGIERVCYVAGVEYNNFFMTGYMWFAIATLFLFAVVISTKFGCGYIVRRRSSGLQRWQGPTRCWRTIMKGLLYRLVCLIGSCSHDH
jgi:hypothetical protein